MAWIDGVRAPGLKTLLKRIAGDPGTPGVGFPSGCWWLAGQGPALGAAAPSEFPPSVRPIRARGRRGTGSLSRHAGDGLSATLGPWVLVRGVVVRGTYGFLDQRYAFVKLHTLDMNLPPTPKHEQWTGCQRFVASRSRYDFGDVEDPNTTDAEKHVTRLKAGRGPGGAAADRYNGYAVWPREGVKSAQIQFRPQLFPYEPPEGCGKLLQLGVIDPAIW